MVGKGGLWMVKMWRVIGGKRGGLCVGEKAGLWVGKMEKSVRGG